MSGVGARMRGVGGAIRRVGGRIRRACAQASEACGCMRRACACIRRVGGWGADIKKPGGRGPFRAWARWPRVSGRHGRGGGRGGLSREALAEHGLEVVDALAGAGGFHVGVGRECFGVEVATEGGDGVVEKLLELHELHGDGLERLPEGVVAGELGQIEGGRDDLRIGLRGLQGFFHEEVGFGAEFDESGPIFGAQIDEERELGADGGDGGEDGLLVGGGEFGGDEGGDGHGDDGLALVG